MTPVERLLSEFEMFASGHVPEIVVSRLPALFDALRAELRPRVTTHHADCWQTRGHHACAIQRIEALRGAIGRLKDVGDHRDLADAIENLIRLASPATPTDGSGA